MDKEKLIKYLEEEINLSTSDIGYKCALTYILYKVKKGEFDNEIPKSTEINNIIKKRKIIISDFSCDNCGSDDNCDCKECLTDNWGLCRVHSGCMCEECDNE